MNSAGRKITVVVLMIVSIAFIVGSIFLATQLQQSQAPDDTGAAGFGEGAIRTNFDAVGQTFRTTPCEVFLNKDILVNTYNPTLVPLSEAFVKSWDNLPLRQEEERLARSCVYDFGNRQIIFNLYAYEADSEIDNTAEELYARINPQQLELPEYGGGIIGENVYFFSFQAGQTDTCQANIYHFQNDFEYASLVYTNTPDCDLWATVELNEAIVELFGNKISRLMEPFILDMSTTE